MVDHLRQFCSETLVKHLTGLGKIIKRPQLNRINRNLRGVAAGHEDHRQVRVVAVELLHQFSPFVPRWTAQVQVCQYKVKLSALGAGETGGGGGGDFDRIAFLDEDPLEELGIIGV